MFFSPALFGQILIVSVVVEALTPFRYSLVPFSLPTLASKGQLISLLRRIWLRLHFVTPLSRAAPHLALNSSFTLLQRQPYSKGRPVLSKLN